jgi:hypothetical protein
MGPVRVGIGRTLLGGGRGAEGRQYPIYDGMITRPELGSLPVVLETGTGGAVEYPATT